MSDPVTLNTKGLLCPLPVIRTQDQIKKMQPGETLLVSCTDPGTQQDIPSWCRVHQHKLAAAWEEADIFYFEIVVAEP